MNTAHCKPVAVHIATRSTKLRQTIEKVVENAMGENGVTFVASPHESQAIIVLFQKDIKFNLGLNNPHEKVRHQVVFLSESKRPPQDGVVHVGVLNLHRLNETLRAAA